MNPVWINWWPVLAAYLLGGVLGGRIVGRLRGVDLRAAGSGNIGATNALRTQGKGFALAVLLIDGSKGALAALLLPQLAVPGTALLPEVLGTPAPLALPYLCGAAAALGHCFPPWYRFNGGKGVATLAGAFLVLLPLTFGWMMVAFVLTVLLTGIVSLATLVSAGMGLVLVLFKTAAILHPATLFTALMLLLVLVTHRENWQRLIAGTESRFERARVLGKWLRLP